MKTAIMVTQLVHNPYNRDSRHYPDGERAWISQPLVHHFPTPLSWRSFTLDASDYDVLADEVRCPCSAVVPVKTVPVTLGALIDAAQHHLDDVHQGVRRD